MFINLRQRRNHASTLLELLIASSIMLVVLAALAAFYVFGVRSTQAMGHYSLLDEANREAMDTLTREIRQAKLVTGYSTNPASISVLNGDDQTVTYTFNTDNQTFTRSSADGVKILLDHCNLLQFSLFQRNPSNASFGVFPAATANWQKTVKVIQLTWRTTMTNNPFPIINSENVQTARIVIRKQQND